MNVEELENHLKELDIYHGFYSLNGELLPDRMVLYHNYNKWEVFYFDERGNRDKEKIFYSEDEACQYLYEHFKKQKEIEKKYL